MKILARFLKVCSTLKGIHLFLYSEKTSAQTCDWELSISLCSPVCPHLLVPLEKAGGGSRTCKGDGKLLLEGNSSGRRGALSPNWGFITKPAKVTQRIILKTAVIKSTWGPRPVCYPISLLSLVFPLLIICIFSLF